MVWPNTDIDLTADYPRDMVGYADQPPHAQWPNQAKIAVQFVLNYEEGGEKHILHGDEAALGIVASCSVLPFGPYIFVRVLLGYFLLRPRNVVPAAAASSSTATVLPSTIAASGNGEATVVLQGLQVSWTASNL